MNIKLLKQVVKAILNHPDNTDLTHWVNHDDEMAACGTTGCIAGWVVAGASLNKLRQIKTVADIPTRTRELLELTKSQTNRLCHLERWPKSFYVAWREACGRPAKSKVIARRIRHFIKTKGR